MANTLPYEHDIAGCLSDGAHDGNRLSSGRFAEGLAALKPAMERLRRDYDAGALPFLHMAEQRADLSSLRAVAEGYRENFRDVVILGTGGSSLGARALHEMAHPRGAAPGLSLSQGREEPIPTLHIITNVDPFSFESLSNRLDPRDTGLIIISKSGRTLETLMQFLTLLPRFQAALGDSALKRHITVITEPGDSPLRRLGRRFGLPMLDHDPEVGGRYSVLSLVGMLPAMIVGIDPLMVRAGAATTLRHALETEDPADIPAAAGAAVTVGLMERRSVSATVMLAYSDRLGSLARWYRQLWAESLGKNGKGATPIYGMGPVDQHSQLQLWLDGPADKMFTVLGTQDMAGGGPIPDALADDPETAFMAGRTLGDLMTASRRATTRALMEAGRPVRQITLAEVDARGLGALLMHFMLETMLSASLLRLNPFDQPAVERGKAHTRALLSGAASGDGA